MAMYTESFRSLLNPTLSAIICLLCLCTSTYEQNPCSLPAHDMGNLTVREWSFASTNMSMCLTAPNTTASNCTFIMQLCGAVTSQSPSCQDASVCQTTAPNQYKLAGKSEKPFSEFIHGKIGFKATFPEGGKYEYITENNTTHTCALETTINFLCNVRKTWALPPEGKTGIVPVQPLIQLTLDGDKCEYNITLEFAGACFTIDPSINTATSLSVGSVLVIIFFVFTIAYFVFGSIWNIACRGARGPEVVPNLNFWTMLPVYVADGFLFTFRCGNMESSSYDSI